MARSAWGRQGQEFFKKHKGELEMRLGVLAPLLIHLESGGVLSRLEREEVEKGGTTSQSQNSVLITMLEKKGAAVQEKLYEALKKHNSVLVEDLQPSAVPETQRGGERREALRIALLGKTGVGKSASGNTILGRDVFMSGFLPYSVTPRCVMGRAKLDGRSVYVVDTPGLFDTDYSNGHIVMKIGECIPLSSPGPHVFLVVIRLDCRFTQEEQYTVEMIKSIFGEESAKYTMVLFTHGDQLRGRPIEQFTSKCKELKEFTKQCHGGYHVFNNEDSENRSQVTELLQKIDEMVDKNGGGYYTTEMYQRAEAELDIRKAQILKETEEKRNREWEDLEKHNKDRLELERAREELRRRQEEEARAAEKCTIL